MNPLKIIKGLPEEGERMGWFKYDSYKSNVFNLNSTWYSNESSEDYKGMTEEDERRTDWP